MDIHKADITIKWTLFPCTNGDYFIEIPLYIWCKNLIYRLKQNVISVKTLSTIIDFLSFRKQRVIYFQWVNFFMD